MRDIDDVVAEVASIPEREIIFVDDDLNGFSRKAKQRCLDLFRAMTDAQTRQELDHAGHDQFRRRRRTAAAGAGGRVRRRVHRPREHRHQVADARFARTGRRSAAASTTIARTWRGFAATASASSGSFILGIDTQDMNTIASDILQFAEESDLDGLNPTILTPLPGTRDYARYDAEGRILFKNYPEDWEKSTLAFPVTSMPNVTGAGLMRRYVASAAVLPSRTHRRALLADIRDRVAEAAWHVYLWNRVWTNYCLRNGAFNRAPLAETYPVEVPRDVPLRPTLDLGTIARSVQPRRAVQPQL